MKKRVLNLGAGTQSSWLYAEMCDMNADQSGRSSEVPNAFARRAVGALTANKSYIARAYIRSVLAEKD